jgi:GMP synthase (glutamine-hydrolysing)
MRVLCLTHEQEGPAGLFVDVARDRGDEVLEWNVATGSPPEPPERFDALVVFGGHMNVYEAERHSWLPAQHDLVRGALDRNQAFLGVCLGAQMVARVMGGNVRLASRPEIGWHVVELTSAGAADPVLGALPERFDALEWHSYAFDLPPGAELLATSAVCPQGFRLGENTWGIQFHPEATLAMLEGWRSGSEGSAPTVSLDPIDRWNELGRRLANAFYDVAKPR